MIRDRNIAKDAAIQATKILGGGMNPAAKTFYAIISGTEYASWVADNIDSESWYADDIGYIIDNWCTDGQPDHILVGPGKWQENVLIRNRQGLSLSAMVEGWFTQFRPGDEATADKITLSSVSGFTIQGIGIAILDRSVSISGFLFDGGGNYTGVYVGDGYRIDTSYDENSASARIRNCIFRGGGEGQVGLLLDGCSDDVLIENNIFRRWEKAGIQIDPGGSRTVQRPVIRRNEFIGHEIYGIDMYSSATTQGVLVRENVFMDSIQAMTYAVRFQGAGKHALVGNWFACTNAWSASATDWISGNFGSNGADGTEVVSEA